MNIQQTVKMLNMLCKTLHETQNHISQTAGKDPDNLFVISYRWFDESSPTVSDSGTDKQTPY